MPADAADPITTRELAAQAAMFRLLVDNAVDVIVRGDATGHRLFVSPSSREVLGYAPEEMLGKHAYELLHPADLERTRVIFEKVGPAHPCLDATFRMRRKDGAYVWVEARYRHLPQDGGLLAVLRDVTERQRAEARLAAANAALARANRHLRQLAQQDGLTGLANRRHFDTLLDQEVRRSARDGGKLGLVLLDADYFKSFNDHYGHLAGDDCLRGIAGAIAGVLRRPADNAARYGGEEIAVLLPATDIGGATLMAERMRAAVLALHIAHEGSTAGVVTVSAGVSALVASRTSGAALLVHTADTALYAAKAAGRNTVCAAPMAALAA